MSTPFKMRGWSPFSQEKPPPRPGSSKGKLAGSELLKLSEQHDALDEKIFNLRQDNKEVPDSLISQRDALGVKIAALMKKKP